MQKHKPRFLDPCPGTITDIQHCLRLNDLDEIGDGTHLLDFRMLGLFSFHEWPIQRGIQFWMRFLSSHGIPPDTVTIPPHRPEWRLLYEGYDVDIKIDPECVWSDGSIGGDCTEFYRNGVEIGNIVNPLGDCLDCGFGSERLQVQLDLVQGVDIPSPTPGEIRQRTIEILLLNGIVPGSQKQGYVLRRLIRDQTREGEPLPSHPLVERETERIKRLSLSISRLRSKHPDKPPEYFWETHGIHPDELDVT